MNMKNIITSSMLLSILIVSMLCIEIAAAAAPEFSIDRVKVNGQTVAESKSNLIEDADSFLVVVDLTTILALERGRVEAVLKGRESGVVVSDATSTFDLARARAQALA